MSDLVKKPNNDLETALITKIFSHAIINGDLENFAGVVKNFGPNQPLNMGLRPIHMAVNVKKPGLVKFLVENGADINVQNDEGFYPLHEASASGNIDIVKILIQNGAHIDSEGPNGVTALFLAVSEAKYETARMLIKHGASIEKKVQGFTVSEVAKLKGDEKMAAVISSI